MVSLQGGQGSLMGMLFPLVIFVVIFYFFIIRPQKKRQKSHDQLISSLGRGDQVVTAGGFWGTVKEVKEDSVIIEIADGVKARVLKSSIANKHAQENLKKPEWMAPWSIRSFFCDLIDPYLSSLILRTYNWHTYVS